MKKRKKNILLEVLEGLLKEARGQDILLETLVKRLAGRGLPVLLMLLSIPLAFPITIPGLSTPFGLLIIFIGFRIAISHPLHLPKRFLERKVSYSLLEKTVEKVRWCHEKIQALVHTRWSFLTAQPFLHRMHGAFISCMGFFLALPLPIPFTNTLAALPIFLISLGMTEDDGVCIALGYILGLICIAFFSAIFWFGRLGISQIANFS